MALTKSQIKAQINQLQTKKQNLEKEKQDYSSSIDYSNKIISNLKTCNKTYLIPANDSLKKYFTINGKTGDDGKTNNIVTEITSIISYMENTVVPDLKYYKSYLETEISNLNTRIQSLWTDYYNAQE